MPESEITPAAAHGLFRCLVEQSLVGILLIQDDRCLYFNPRLADIFGYTPEEVLALPSWLELVAPEDRPLVEGHVRRRLSGAEPSARYTFRGRRKDGTLIDIEVHGTRVDYDGRPAVLGTLLDVSERYRLEAELRQAQKMEAVGRLAGGIAHDFNNLLTVVLGCADLVLEDVAADHRAHVFVRDIKAAADRAATLTQQLLAFSRKQVLVARVLNLNDLVTDMARILRRLIGAGIELVTLPTLGACRVKVDPGQLGQVLLNLAVNARDAMPGGGKLTIRTAEIYLDEAAARGKGGVRPGCYVVLSVGDTGCGMTPEVKARVFEPFFTTKRPTGGTGLGLSTVYGIVKQSGGHVEVDSEPGRGTTFTVYLPCHREEAGAAAAAAVSTAEVARGRETILLVEDEAAVRALEGTLLRGAGYTVLEAGYADDALRVSAEYAAAIDLLVTDVVMPRMSGWALAEQLTVRRPGLRVLFVSGYAEGIEARDGSAPAGAAFLQKPFSPDALLRAVREVLDRPR
jgi:PAS domain S-box-containing protein